MIRITAVSAVALLGVASPSFAVTVTSVSDAEALASAIQGTSGASISNPVLSGGAGSAGTFTGGTASGIGIEEGVILSTGQVTDAVGPNSSGSTGDLGISEASLSFAFQSTTGNIFFDYVFASEEYNEFVNSSFNDTFTFLVNGPGFSDENIALLPGTSTAVEIDTVNLGFNSDLYNDNEDGAFDLEYDGFTDVLQATLTGLTIDAEYILSLIVEDVGDSGFDSAVFIAGSSFADEPVDPTPPVDTPPANVIPLPAGFPLVLSGLAALLFFRKRRS